MTLSIDIGQPVPQQDNPSAAKVNSPPVTAIKLPRFFNQILENKVKEVAMMALYHMIHFFCALFWKEYQTQFAIRISEHQKLAESKKLKLVQQLLEAKTKATAAEGSSIGAAD